MKCENCGEYTCCGINKELQSRVADLERDCAELSSQLSENMCGYCDRKMNGEIYVSDLETEIQQQQQTIELSERYRKSLIDFFDIKGNPHWGDVAVLIGAKVREMKQTIERYEAALRYIAYEYYKHDHGYHFLAELAHDALTHKTGGEK